MKKASLILPGSVRQDSAEAVLTFLLTLEREVCRTEAWQGGQRITPGDRTFVHEGLKLLGVPKNRLVVGCSRSKRSEVAWQDTKQAVEPDTERGEVLSQYGRFRCFVRVWTLSCRFSNGFS